MIDHLELAHKALEARMALRHLREAGTDLNPIHVFAENLFLGPTDFSSLTSRNVDTQKLVVLHAIMVKAWPELAPERRVDAAIDSMRKLADELYELAEGADAHPERLSELMRFCAIYMDTMLAESRKTPFVFRLSA